MIRLSRLALLSLVLSFQPTFFASAHDDTPTRGISPKLISQGDIPFTITKSGEYELTENVSLSGSGNAITIKANNVKLNLGSFSITLTNPAANGVLVEGCSEFVIESDSIHNTSSGNQTGCGILVRNVQKGLISGVFTKNHADGLRIKNSSDIRVQSSGFSHAKSNGASVINSKNVVFDACVFDGSKHGLTFSGANQDCSVLHSMFPSSKFTNLLVQQMSGMLVQDCSFSEVDGNSKKPSLVQFGDKDPTQTCKDVILKNCTIVNKSTNTAPEGLGIYQGSGFLVESCVIDTTNVGQDPAADLSGIHISNPGLGTIASNVIVRNCVIQGSPTDGIYPDTGPGGGAGSSGVLIEGCLVSGALKDGIFLAGTSASTVRDCTVVNNGTNGIFLGETCVSNAVVGNTVASNGFAIIGSSLLPQGAGIGITSDSSKNTVQYNQVFSNANNGINDLGAGDTFYYNTAYNNPTNYSAGILNVSTPGAAAKAGENIAQ